MANTIPLYVRVTSSLSIPLGCSHVLAIVTSAAMNTAVPIPFGITVFSQYMPRSGASFEGSENVLEVCEHLLITW